ncbi:LytTR family DNA-binding domain-containing protein [Membranicola marinus]|uniref:LytTR family DNA-binding domain-containing protein n=1 Tax=Membranihabitans marinus TaxID=1227546 RepID=A0A953HUV2_9BACT|nr:LytTR family DNA-binding domain-containing protein [Membranihabitans marinus]MBY5958626.1 LytTR family DNA-binding domain-containing protein [Membranihabitans marinus]
MSKINCLVVDDEEPARRLIENYINRLPNLHLVGKCANPLSAIEVMQEHQVDLMFLDIQMPELTGVEFLKTMTTRPLVIFTTAYKEYALEGYELDVVDYLLKPFRFERFVQAVHKAMHILKPKVGAAVNLAGDGPAEKQESKDYLLVKSDFKVYRIFFRDIQYIESMKEYVAYHTPEGRTLSLGSLKSLEEELPADQFIRIHKSYIVSKAKVSALDGNQVQVGNQKLPIGSSYRKAVIEALF